MAKKPKLSPEMENEMLSGLNTFMKDYGIDEIQFGNKHSLKRDDKSDKAQPVIKNKKKSS